MHKILVVDDEVTITTHLEERLNWMGCEVVGRASSGEESINMARRHNPDLILMDIIMPGELDGIDASKIIKKELDIPIVFLTAYPDDKFVKRAKHVEPFGYLVKPINPDEIRATIEVALHKKDVERGLYELLEEYCALVDSINYAIITVDSHKNITFWNHGAEDIFGYTADEALGMPITFIMPERFREGYENEMSRVILSRKSNIIGKVVELNGLRKDGIEFPFEFSMAFWKKKEVIFFTCIGCDITERKRAEEKIKASLREKETLLQEIHHRAKNNLQVISSLLKLQSEYIEDKQASQMFKDSQGRIKSMALIHEKLYKSRDLAEIDFKIYINDLVYELFRSYEIDPSKIALRMDVKDISLRIDTAIPCGLIINELVSNCLKYAFPRGREGKIRVVLRSINKNEIELKVKDNGVGLPEDFDFRKTKSLGLHIVTILAEDQLDGKIELNRAGGTEFKITFKRGK